MSMVTVFLGDGSGEVLQFLIRCCGLMYLEVEIYHRLGMKTGNFRA